MTEEMDIISKSGFDRMSIDVAKLLGKKVLTESGLVLGKIKQIRINPESSAVEGVVLKRFFKKMYIGIEYFDKLSESAVVLSIEPSVLIIGKKVIDSEGKVIGKVKEIQRINESNALKSIFVKKFLRKGINISVNDIKYLGKSIILKGPLK